MSYIEILMKELELSDESITSTMTKIDAICSQRELKLNAKNKSIVKMMGNGNGNGNN